MILTLLFVISEFSSLFNASQVWSDLLHSFIKLMVAWYHRLSMSSADSYAEAQTPGGIGRWGLREVLRWDKIMGVRFWYNNIDALVRGDTGKLLVSLDKHKEEVL